MRRGEVFLAGIARCFVSLFRPRLRGHQCFIFSNNCTYIVWPKPFGRCKVVLLSDMIERFLLLCFTSTTNLIGIAKDMSKLSSYGCLSAILIHNVKE